MKARWIGLALVFIVVSIFFDGTARADGLFLPEPHQKLPDIPIQRALVKYRHGVETLIVESTLEGKGEKFSWIIPVPSKPLRFERISPGFLQTLSFVLQPEITHHLPLHSSAQWQGELYWGLFVVWAILMFLSFLYILFKGWPGMGRIVVFDLLLPMALFVGIPVAVFLVFGGRYTSGVSLGPNVVRVESTRWVGNYEVSVLKAKKSSDLNDWLTANGFMKFPEDGLEILQYYIDNNWYFVAGKINNPTMEGKATPHPVLMEFKTERPVYPMRLTALPGSTVNLELFTLAEQEAVPVGYQLKKEYCDIFDKIPLKAPHEPEGFIGRNTRSYRTYHTIGHPAATKVMWNGCVVTKLGGEISSDKMKEDMFLSFRDTVPYRSHVYSKKLVLRRALLWAVLVGMFGLQAVGYFYSEEGKKFTLSLVILVCVVGVIFSGIYCSHKKVEVTSQVNRTDWRVFNLSLMAFKADLAGKLSTISDSEFMAAMQKDSSLINLMTEKPLILEDSPGNITLQRKDGKLSILFYLWDGTPILDENNGTILESRTLQRRRGLAR